MSIKVTANAFKRVGELVQLENNLDLVLRVSVDGGGCAGFMYNYELVLRNTIENDDSIIEQNGIIVIIDSMSQQFMQDCIVDFIEDLGSSYFEIRNSKAKTKCGCGSSFSV